MNRRLQELLLRPFVIGLVLFAIMAVSTVARLSDIEAKSGIWHDESISYLMAGCAKPNLSYLGKAAIPTSASEWKSLYMIDRPFCFSEIAQAVSSDTHPPLFYWLLNVWAAYLGVQLWTGPVLNLFLALFTIVILYLAAKDILNNALEALLVASIYALMPPIVHITAEARQYQLLSLLSLVLVWLAIRLTRKPSKLNLVEVSLVVVVVAAGALTHYYFFLTTASVAIFILLRLARQNYHRLASLLGALVVGCILANWLFPIVDHLTRRAGRNRAQFDILQLETRLARLKMAVHDFDLLWYGLVLGVIALIVGAIILLLVGGRSKPKEHLRCTKWNGIEILWFPLWQVATIILLYVSFFSPRHAMGAKYFSIALPLIPFVVIFLLRLLRNPSVLVVYFPLVALFFLAGDVHTNVITSEFHLQQRWGADDIILVDARARGILPQILWHLPDDQQVIVGYQDFLIENFHELAHYLGSNVGYISDNSYGNNEEKRQLILELVQEEGYRLEEEVASIPIRSGIARRDAPIFVLRSDE